MTELQIINGIKNSDNRTLRFIYSNYYDSIRKMVYQFKNTKLDPDEIFQEGIIRAVMNVQQDKFQGKSSFLTYVSGICRNICLKTLNDKKMQSAVEIADNINDEEDDNSWEKIKLIVRVKDKMDTTCREIIDLRFGKDDQSKQQTFDEIAVKLNINPDNARQRFKRCIDKLREMILNDKQYLEFET